MKESWMAWLLAVVLATSPLTGCTNGNTTTDLPQQSSEVLTGGSFSMDQVAAYSGEAYVVVHDNIPYFTEGELTTDSYESYSPLDALGRCGVAMASVGQDLMPTEDRGSIGQVKPSGWQTVKYDMVDGKYLYNRCHLLGYQLTGENANEENLITGTRYLNIEGMLPFENLVADYVQETDNHVLYRVTPVFTDTNLVADGVLMEGWSVEDGGEDICFCVFAYNVQPGITIDYATGDSWLSEADDSTESPQETQGIAYVLNTNTMKFHDPDCSSADDIDPANRKEYTGDREDLIAQGYAACGRCKP